MKKKYFLILLIIGVFIYNKTYSQNPEAVNNIVLSNGDIFSSSNGVLKGGVLTKTQKQYDELILGVYYSTSDSLTSKLRLLPYKVEGIYNVKYNSENGLIHKGDLVTSSSVPGEAMKATQSGMTLGIALEDAIAHTGLIKIRILIQYVKQ